MDSGIQHVRLISLPICVFAYQATIWIYLFKPKILSKGMFNSNKIGRKMRKKKRFKVNKLFLYIILNLF